ncbi:MAG: UDP-N-acetylmuramoyl-tripeptide--D-alanyl-D-alanine ligase [Candidatus Omnitrophota bacterium]
MLLKKNIMTIFSLKELAKIAGADATDIKKDINVSGISTDSRTIKKGEVFLALKGENFDGTDFIDDAAAKGAVAVITSEDVEAKKNYAIINVKNTAKSLSDIARAHRDKFNIPVIAITGSSGKTTTKDMAAHILSVRYKVLKTHENENNNIGVPSTILKLKDENIAVIEVGTNSFGEIRQSAEVLRPNIAVITNIGPSHLEGLRDRDGVLMEKIALVEALAEKGTWVKNCDDEMLMSVPKVLRSKATDSLSVLTYSINSNKADFRALNFRYVDKSIMFDLIADNTVTAFSLPMMGVHSVYNALAAIACCSPFVSIVHMKERLSNFKQPHMRMEVLSIDGFTIIDDSYNSNPASLKHALSALSECPASGERIAVIADMLELGEDSRELHYEAGKFLAEKNISYLLTFGERALDIAKGAISNGMQRNNVVSFKNKDEVVNHLRDIAGEGDVVLIKGSRGMKMEEVVNCFTTCSTR